MMLRKILYTTDDFKKYVPFKSVETHNFFMRTKKMCAEKKRPNELFELVDEIETALEIKIYGPPRPTEAKELNPSRPFRSKEDITMRWIVREYLQEKIVQLHETFEEQTPEIKQMISHCLELIGKMTIGIRIWE